MVRSSQATTTTFSTTPYFMDRGPHGTAQPITERINVRAEVSVGFTSTKYLVPFVAPFTSNSFILFPQRSWNAALWCKSYLSVFESV